MSPEDRLELLWFTDNVLDYARDLKRALYTADKSETQEALEHLRDAMDALNAARAEQ